MKDNSYFEEEDMMCFRLQKLKLEGMIMDYNLQIFEFLEANKNLSEKQKGYLLKELIM